MKKMFFILSILICQNIFGQINLQDSLTKYEIKNFTLSIDEKIDSSEYKINKKVKHEIDSIYRFNFGSYKSCGIYLFGNNTLNLNDFLRKVESCYAFLNNQFNNKKVSFENSEFKINIEDDYLMLGNCSSEIKWIGLSLNHVKKNELKFILWYVKEYIKDIKPSEYNIEIIGVDKSILKYRKF